ncbi:MAG: hypothetical protein ACI94Y_001408, partial [Maribacter sp.]
KAVKAALRLSVIRFCQRSIVQKDEVKTDSYLFNIPKVLDNIIQFILLPFIPNDLRLSMGQDIIKSKRKDIIKLYTHPEIGKMILSRM